MSSFGSKNSNDIVKSKMNTENEDGSLIRLNNNGTNNKYDKVKLYLFDDDFCNKNEAHDNGIKSPFKNYFNDIEYQNIGISSKTKNNFLNNLDAKNKINIEFEKLKKNKHENSSKNLFLEERYKNNLRVTDMKDYFTNNFQKKKRVGSEINKHFNNYDEYYFHKKFNTEGFQMGKAVKEKDFIFKSPKIYNSNDFSKEFLNEIQNYDLVSKKKFLKDYYLTSINKDYTFNCKIKVHTNKNKVGLLYPIYTLHVDSTDRFILAAKKVKITSASSYLFSLDENNFEFKSDCYLGKLNSNFLGTKFKIFDYKDKNKNEKNFIEREGSKDISEIEYVTLFIIILISRK